MENVSKEIYCEFSFRIRQQLVYLKVCGRSYPPPPLCLMYRQAYIIECSSLLLWTPLLIVLFQICILLYLLLFTSFNRHSLTCYRKEDYHAFIKRFQGIINNVNGFCFIFTATHGSLCPLLNAVTSVRRPCSSWLYAVKIAGKNVPFIPVKMIHVYIIMNILLCYS